MSEPFNKLVEIMARLRGPDGCPWDREQTHKTLKPYLIEEAYETLEAIDTGKSDLIKEELGDLLLQVVFHAEMAKEEGTFNIDDVCDAISDKLIRRHPHVFGDSDADTPEKVMTQWEEIKRAEKTHRHRKSVLDGAPMGLPALLLATKLQKKAGSVGFDWDKAEDAFAKVEEELDEFRHAFANQAADEMEEELGDLLFALVNIARFIEVNPEEALRKTIDKFVWRFKYIEKKIEQSGREMENVTLDEMESIWIEAKTKQKG